MLRHKPSFSYCGLTIVLSNPSRFDKVALLSANGGAFFDNECLRPDINRHQCDIRVKEDKSEFLPGTKCVILLGEEATREWLRNADNTIGEIRGSVYNINGIPHIPTFFPQDAADIKDYESERNPIHNSGTVSSEHNSPNDEDDEGGFSEKRRHGRTKRKNFQFWCIKDLAKAKHILKNGLPSRPFNPEYVICPPSELIIQTLTQTKNEDFNIDIETDEQLNIRCFAYSFGYGNPIFCVPLLDHNYNPFYSRYSEILRSFAIALRDNTAVAYNGHTFDFLVFAYKLKIAIGRKSFDPMLAHFRCYPGIEKSLGHATSLWTYEPFHKDEGNVGYNSVEQVKQTLAYCGKDVYTMILIKKAILDYAKRVPGLTESIYNTMRTIRPYLICTLQGIAFDEQERAAMMKENDRLMMQYLRIIDLLIGENTVKALKKRFHSALPTSNPQCCHYFHELLDYPVVGRGKTKKDGTRGASLAKQNMFKLRLKYENPVIDFCIAYREVAKESGSLKFIPWKVE
jgi:hypothetical protein